MSRSSPAAGSQSDDDKPYYQCKHNLRCKKCNGYWPDKCRCKQTIPSKDHQRFQTWFTDWRGVFANETQALAIFNAAQPENETSPSTGATE
jgi:hypothetical protein